MSPMILRFFHVDDMDDKFQSLLMTKSLLSEIYTFSNRSASLIYNCVSTKCGAMSTNLY